MKVKPANYNRVKITTRGDISGLFNKISSLEKQLVQERARLDWVLEHNAMVFTAQRMKTRAGGMKQENMETGFVLDYYLPDGTNVIQGADLIQPTKRDAIDAAMKGSQ